MKVRNGFVSNSSSSSFIVGIPLECVTFEDFLEKGTALDYGYGFVKSDDVVEDWDTYSETPMTNRDCVKQLWEDIFRVDHKVSIEKLIDDMHSGYIPSGNLTINYDFVDVWAGSGLVFGIYEELYGKDQAEKIRKKLMRIGDDWNSIVGEALMRDIFKYFEGNLYEIEYSDNDGSLSSIMEHGAFWQYVPHLRFSHH